jgi:hypothetical protein
VAPHCRGRDQVGDWQHARDIDQCLHRADVVELFKELRHFTDVGEQGELAFLMLGQLSVDTFERPRRILAGRTRWRRTTTTEATTDGG